jgi:hypothetical protein
MPWSTWQQTSEHGRTKYFYEPDAQQLVEASGTLQINDFSVTYYTNELGRFEVTATRPIRKKGRNILVSDMLEFRLETSASIPKFISIKKQKAEGNNWKYETFIEIDDGKNSIVPEFNDYQQYEPYSRKYFNSSIIKAYDFIKEYLPEFEEFIQDKKVADHATKIVERAQTL